MRIDHDAFGYGKRGPRVDSAALVGCFQFFSSQDMLAELTGHFCLGAVELKVGLHANCSNFETALALIARFELAKYLLVSLDTAQRVDFKAVRVADAADFSKLKDLGELRPREGANKLADLCLLTVAALTTSLLPLGDA